ncbi:MAG: hypothetical protein K2V38_15115 [Gemmataceae bacterium]|nr:hypothetical protein [Gemmataceae bacterium]
MGTTFVRLREHGFWTSDSILELWLRLLALHIEEPAEPNSVSETIRNRWLLASRGFFMGCVPVGLDEAVSSGEGERIIRAAIHSLLGELEHAPPELDSGVLNLLGFTNGIFTANIKTRRLIEVGRALLDLLDGKITTGPSDPVSMLGCE